MRAPNSLISRAIARLLAMSSSNHAPGWMIDTIAVAMPFRSISASEIAGDHGRGCDPMRVEATAAK
jgi:hypothetical protein